MSSGFGTAGSATVLGEAGEVWSAARLEAEADVLASRLREATRGDARPRIAHRFGPRPEAVVALHAIARAGARLAPVHPGWDDDQVASFVRAVDPDLWLTEPGAGTPGAGWSVARGAGGAAAAIRVLARGAGVARGARAELPPGTDVLLSTSGTTGSPRIVCHSWGTLRANAEAAAHRNGFGAGDTWLATLAWAHVGGLAVAVRAAVAGGRIAFGPSRFAPGEMVEALGRFGATHVSLVPAMLHAVLDHGSPPPPSLRCALVGGAATPPALAARAVDAGWPIALTYGLTEMGSQVATGWPGAVPEESGVAGPPLDGIELRIGPDGEIEVRGPSRALGTPGHPLPAGAWLSTGDLGSLDAAGRLRVTGRRADRIVTGGANVDPLEIEAVLAGHSGVREVCVVGTPDDVWGEIVTAVWVGGCPPVAGEDDPPPDLVEWAENRLTGPRRPRRWWRVETLPRTAGGKMDRVRIRGMASQREATE